MRISSLKQTYSHTRDTCECKTQCTEKRVHVKESKTQLSSPVCALISGNDVQSIKYRPATDKSDQNRTTEIVNNY